MATEEKPLDPEAEREMKAVDAGLAGRPVDAELNDFAELAVALRQARPKPEADFAAELDQAVADHFPPEWAHRRREGAEPQRLGRGPLSRLLDWLDIRGRKLLPVGAAVAGLAVVVVSVGIGLDQGPLEGGSETTQQATSEPGAERPGAVLQNLDPGDDESAESNSSSPFEPGTNTPLSGGSSRSIERAGGAATESTDQIFDGANRYAGPADPRVVDLGRSANNRKVAEDVAVTLGAKPEDVQEVSNEIIEVVDGHNGIVLRSRVTDGPAGEAGARFSLTFPSGKLEPALAELSSVADLRARSQNAVDITAPTLGAREVLQTARARVESLVNQLAEASTEEERTRIERELAQERRKVSRRENRLNRLERRASLTPVTVVVETSGDTSGDDGAWGLGDAFDDAARMLGVSAGVALIALAIGIPIALMLLLALALNRAWVARSRKRALREG